MWWPWVFWMRMATLPLEVMSASAKPVRTHTPETEHYLVRELRDDLEKMGVQGIIDEGGRP